MNFKLKNSVLMTLSEMIDVMDIKREIVNINGKTNEEVGKELVMLLITKLYKAKRQYYDFVIKFKNIKIEDENLSEEGKYEKAIEIVENMDAVEIFKELIQIEGLSDFLASK